MKLDKYGIPISWNINGEFFIKSIVGGLMYLIIIINLIFVSSNELYKLFYNTTPTVGSIKNKLDYGLMGEISLNEFGIPYIYLD